MQTITAVAPLRTAIADLRRGGRPVALVPTMGALHEGHVSLVEKAVTMGANTVASIFVNPTQFGPDEDLGRYPRQEQTDAALLAQAGCDVLFLPAVEAVYPPGFTTSVHVGGLTDVMEGASRPGHFDGVATVVTKLLLMALPDIAIFGEKDWQQLAVIRRFVRDLDIPVRIVGAPIVRDRDGLALSSRNAYLSAGERQQAAHLPVALKAAIAAIRNGEAIDRTLAAARQQLETAGFRIDYLTLANGDTLQPLDRPDTSARLFVAASLGKTRLIDNMALQAGEEP